MKLSVVIPAHNEEGCIESTVVQLSKYLVKEAIPHEIIVVDDGSTDQTPFILEKISGFIPELRWVKNSAPNGFGYAVRCGLSCFSGDAVAIYMADASDTPEDLARFYKTFTYQKVDCVFGTRWEKQSKVVDYPWFKLILNRLVNRFIQLLFGIRYNDVTNAFKLYSRRTIKGVEPILSPHFNLTVELPLKAIVRGYSYTVLPNTWINRKTGESKLKIKEMGSRYLFIILYCFIEKWLSRGDYRISPPKEAEPAISA
ncbi:MAG: glycosyltransferase family 2 protein [Proteobacteria bacterium]|nr:glycosyltransferase family 2 protein [Pseudomonadota bacterium]NBY20422.1 glycosyltransferase family 2 protein [bacterium]